MRNDLTKLCWSKTKKRDYEELKEFWKLKYNGIYNKFFSYFEKQWSPILETLLDYRKIDQSHRSNSMQESYNYSLQSKITHTPTLKALIDLLIQETDEKEKEFNLKTKRGVYLH